MDQLDNNKIPNLGSSGQRYRRQQIISQFPRQDISLEYCKTIKVTYNIGGILLEIHRYAQ